MTGFGSVFMHLTRRRKNAVDVVHCADCSGTLVSDLKFIFLLAVRVLWYLEWTSSWIANCNYLCDVAWHVHGLWYMLHDTTNSMLLTYWARVHKQSWFHCSRNYYWIILAPSPREARSEIRPLVWRKASSLLLSQDKIVIIHVGTDGEVC